MGCLRVVLTGRTTVCIRSGPVGQVSYRESEAPCRRRHSYSGISTLHFSLVFFVARCLVFVLSSAFRVIVVFGILSVVRVRGVFVVFGGVVSSFVFAAFNRALFERLGPFRLS